MEMGEPGRGGRTESLFFSFCALLASASAVKGRCGTVRVICWRLWTDKSGSIIIGLFFLGQVFSVFTSFHQFILGTPYVLIRYITIGCKRFSNGLNGYGSCGGGAGLGWHSHCTAATIFYFFCPPTSSEAPDDRSPTFRQKARNM